MVLRNLCCQVHWLSIAGYNNLDSGYAFGYDSIAFGPMSDMISYQRDLVRHTALSFTYVSCELLSRTTLLGWDA